MGFAIAAGLLAPVLIGIALLAHLRETQIERELQADLSGKVALLSSSLVTPVWNFDTPGITKLT